MKTLDMDGPFSLTNEEIDRRIASGKPGNYAYGRKDEEGAFLVQYVGRSDTDLNDRIKHGIKDGYKLFKFSYASTPKEAYEKECRNYHDFGGDRGKLHNEIHPAKPERRLFLSCPHCDE